MINLKSIKSLLTAVILLLILSGSGCKKAPEQDEKDELTIVCTLYPVYIMTLNVVGDVPGIRVENLIPPEAGCPHDYSMTPADAALLEKADVLVMSGLGIESFLDDNPLIQREDLQIITASESIRPIYNEWTSEDDAHVDPDHDHSINPHTWVSPVAAAEMTRKIGKKLSRIDDKHIPVYIHNAHRYTLRLDSLSNSFKELFSEVPNRKIITQYANFAYFARDLGLQVVGNISLDSGQEPSAREISELIKLIVKTQPIGIFYDAGASRRIANMLAEETGLQAIPIDPGTSGPDDPEAYINAMLDNIWSFEKALATELREN